MKRKEHHSVVVLLLSSVAACSAFDAPTPRPKCESRYQYEYCDDDDDSGWITSGGTHGGDTGGSSSGGAMNSCSTLYEPDASFEAPRALGVDRLFAWRSSEELDAASTTDDFTLGDDELGSRELALLEASGLGRLAAQLSSPLRVWHNGFANRLDPSTSRVRDRLVEIRLRPEALFLHVAKWGYVSADLSGNTYLEPFDVERVGVVVLDLSDGAESCEASGDGASHPYRTILVGNPEWIEGWESGTPPLVEQQRQWASAVSSLAETTDPRANFAAPGFAAGVACLWSSGVLNLAAGCPGVESYLNGLASPTLDYAPSVGALSALAEALEPPSSSATWSWSPVPEGEAGGATFD